MYQALLIWRYLTSKIMPLLAAVAVVLCTAMVLIVWSVMGGFLNMLLASGRTLIGDVAVVWPMVGFGHYEDLIERLEADPWVEAAAPIIETYGLLSLPDGRIEPVTVKGIEPGSFDRVTSYDGSLWWRPLDEPLPKDEQREDPRLLPANREALESLYRWGRSLTMESDVPGQGARPAMVVGIEVNGYRGRRQPEGWIALGPGFLPGKEEVTLSLMPLDRRGRTVDAVARVFPVANEFRTGLFEIDNKTVVVRLDALQDMLNMDEARRLAGPVDPFAIEGEPETAGVEPARVTTVLVRAASGIDANRLRERVAQIYGEFAAAHRGERTVPPSPPILTWEDSHRTLISAVKKETYLVLFIFGIISLTAVFLILAIFWAMVSEKTKDIGILRSVGASRSGVAGLWLGYGLAIGVVGSAMGGVVALLVIRNINEIHDWIGQTTGRLFGSELYIWDPSVYYFTQIPSEVEPMKAAIVLTGGVLASVAGALIPAVKAARMDPVRALRFE